MDTNSIKQSSDSGNLLLLLKNGDSHEIVGIDGGGMMVSDEGGTGIFGSEGGYEIFVIVDPSGTQECFAQSDIAAIVDLDDNCQVEFGNQFLPSEVSDHPRSGARLSL